METTDKIELDFMVVPDYLANHTFVPDPVRCRVTNLEKLVKFGILGESGIRMASAGAEFFFTRELADNLIDVGAVVESIHEAVPGAFKALILSGDPSKETYRLSNLVDFASGLPILLPTSSEMDEIRESAEESARDFVRVVG